MKGRKEEALISMVSNYSMVSNHGQPADYLLLTNLYSKIVTDDKSGAAVSRVVVEASRKPSYTLTLGRSSTEITVDFPNASWNMPSVRLPVENGVVHELVVEKASGRGAQLVIYLEEAVRPRVWGEEGLPARLILDFPYTGLERLFRGRRLVIDPGHGGRDRGAIGPTGLTEKEVALDIARRLEKLLSVTGAQVTVTRRQDEEVPISQRLELIHKVRPHVVLSIHTATEAWPPPWGSEVYVLHTNPASEHLRAVLLHEMANRLPPTQRCIEPAGFRLLRESNCPVAVIEVGNIVNRLEEGLLRDWDYKQKIAMTVFHGVVRFFRQAEGNQARYNARDNTRIGLAVF